MRCGDDVTIIVPQRGRAELTLQCVRSLRDFEGSLPSVLVVDDGSGNDSAAQVRRAALPNCRVVEQPALGVTAAWNTGLRNVQTSEVVLLNNDVVVRGQFLERLLDSRRTRQAAIMGAEWRVEPLAPRRLAAQLPGHRLLAGWCFAFGLGLWRRLGGFDEAMKLYWSDTDFQCRAVEHLESTAPHGILRSAGPLPLRHLGHQTVRLDPRRSLQWQQDRSAFLRKWSADPSCSRSAMSDGLSAERRRVPGR